MANHPFELADDVYWGSMSAALGPVTDRLGEKAFQGIVVDAPARCVLDGRNGLPLVGLHRVSFRDEKKQPFTERGIVMASRVEDGRAWARLIVPPEPAEDPTEPASQDDDDPGVGFYTSNFALDLTDVGVPRDPDTTVVAAAALGALCSNRTSTRVVRSPRAVVDPAVEALAKERLEAARPEPCEPKPRGASPTYAKQVDSPALPPGKEAALALTVPKRGQGTLPIKGSFRLPVRPRHLVRPTVEGAPLDVGDPLAKAVLPLAIVVTGERVPGPWLVPLRVAAHQAPGADGLVIGHFALDLLADGGLRVRTKQRYVLYALAGEAFAGPYEVELSPS